MPYAPWGGNFSLYNYNLPLGNNTGGGSGGGQTGGQAGGFTGYSSLPNYGISPAPTQGQGAYGLVPGQIGIPPSTYQQSTTALPGLGGLGTDATNVIKSQIGGVLSPQQERNIQDIAAKFGVSSGMPGTNAAPGSLAFNRTLRDIGLDTGVVQQQGLQNYNSLLGAVGQQQINPALAAEIANANAQLRAAPDPQAAAQQQLANYWAALAATRSLGLRGSGGGGGYGFDPAGGTGRYSAPPFDPSQYGFGFNTLGQQGQHQDSRFSNTGSIPNYPSSSNPIQNEDMWFSPNYGPTGVAPGGYYDPYASTQDYWDMSQNDSVLPPQYNDFQSYYDDLGGY